MILLLFLPQTTEKMLRQQLEQELGQDLSSKKKLIRKEVRLAGRRCLHNLWLVWAFVQPAKEGFAKACQHPDG